MNTQQLNFNQHGMAFDWSTFQPRGGPRQLVRFWWKADLDMQRTRMEGRPIYEKVEFVTIQMPGEINQIIERPANDMDRARWPNEYHAHQNATAYVPEGTPVEFLFSTNPQIVATLKSAGVHVVEDLVALTANAIQTIGLGCQDWVNAGKKYLEMSSKGVKYHEMEQMKAKHEQAETALQNQIADLQRQYNNLVSQMQQNTPAFAADRAIAMAAQASAVPEHRPMPAVPIKDPNAWNPPPDGAIDRRDTIKSKLRRVAAENDKRDNVQFKEETE